eukprot:6191138-Pleurochrysis_carterae.AAC.2
MGRGWRGGGSALARARCSARRCWCEKLYKHCSGRRSCEVKRDASKFLFEANKQQGLLEDALAQTSRYLNEHMWNRAGRRSNKGAGEREASEAGRQVSSPAGR